MRGVSAARVRLKARHSGQWSIVRVVLVGFDMEQRLAVLQPHLFEGVPLPAVSQQAGVPLRTARRWVAAYRAGGADGLTRAARADRDTRRIPAQVVEVVEGLALRRPPPRIAEVHRAVTAIATAQGWPTPSYQSVRRIIQGLDRGLLAMAHHHPDVYRDEFELVLRRESAHPNDVWQADHTELDIMVLDETGRPARPWLTVILDDHSRAIPGYTVFLGDPTTAQTALALRQAIWRKPDPGWAVRCARRAVQRPWRGLHQHPPDPDLRGLEGAVDPQRTGPAPRQREGRAAVVRHEARCRIAGSAGGNLKGGSWV